MAPGCKAVKSNVLDPTHFLYSSDDGDDDGLEDTQVTSAPKKRIRMIHIEDRGSQPRKVTVDLQGVTL